MKVYFNGLPRLLTKSRNDRFATPSLRGSVSVANTTKQSKRKDK